MSNPAKLRVVQWATGGVGKAAIECVLNHPQLELVGCWVHSADKNGRDVGEILGIEIARRRRDIQQGRGARPRRRLRGVQPADPQRRRGRGHSAVRQERGDPGRLGVPGPEQPRGQRRSPTRPSRVG